MVLTADTGPKAASLPRGAGRPVLCFAVSGGAPGGRVSWLLTTTPKLPASDAADAVISPPAAAPRAAPRAAAAAAAATPGLKLEKPSKPHRRSASTGVLGLSPKDLKTLVTASASATAAAANTQ